jgi:hypothetical protein
MALLKEHIGTITCPGDRATVFVAVLCKLERLQIPVETKNERDGTILVHCVSRPLDLFVWRCRSDKLLIQLTEDGHGRTSIRLDAIPNLFRISIGQHEHEIKLDRLLEELRRPE